ncbi:unnamed protein product [Closterium sp. NIES-64]|nr:unnamed protein product [Closterium sp. NIES-64]
MRLHACACAPLQRHNAHTPLHPQCQRPPRPPGSAARFAGCADSSHEHAAGEAARLAHSFLPCPCLSTLLIPFPLAHANPPNSFLSPLPMPIRLAHSFPPLLTSSPPSSVGSYVDGEPMDDALWIFKWMHATAAAAEAEDNNLSPLEGRTFSVLGLGNRQYELLV